MGQYWARLDTNDESSQLTGVKAGQHFVLATSALVTVSTPVRGKDKELGKQCVRGHRSLITWAGKSAFIIR